MLFHFEKRGQTPCLIVLLVAAAAAAACGKKGSPLAPLRLVPAQVADLTARRLGSDVYLQFTIPDKNQDGTTPANAAEMRAYGLTLKPITAGPEPPPLEPREFTKIADEVGRVEVRPPPEEEEDAEKAKNAKAQEGAEAAKVAEPPAPVDPRPAQGTPVVVVEKLTAEQFTPVERPVRRRRRRQQAELVDKDVVAPLIVPITQVLPVRTYLVLGYNPKVQEGPSARVQVPLVDPPAAPPAPRLSYTETGFTVAWRRPPFLRRRAQETLEPNWDEIRSSDAPIEPPPRPGVPVFALYGPPIAAKPIFTDTVPTAYNVYEAPSGPPAGAPAVLTMPMALNATPLEVTKYEDSRLTFGTERCYVIRAVDAHGDLKIESDASPRACITPIDTYAPPAPTNLAAVASEGGISLIWEAGKAPGGGGAPPRKDDLAGYLILRAEAPEGVPAPLMTEPLKETTYRDTTVRPGVRYIYLVVAVDTATPPNMSAQSNRVEETAR